MSASYYDAIAERIAEQDPRLEGRVFDTVLERDGEPRRGTYVVLFLGNPSELQAGRFTKAQTATSDAVYDFTARTVAEGTEGIRDVSASVFAALVGFKPDVDGRDCSKITHRGSDPIAADTDISPPLLFADDDFRFRSYAA